MGSFWGHIDEGLFFILLAVWWMLHAFREYILAESRDKTMRPSIHYNVNCKKQIPVEIIFKILFPVVGFLGELIDSNAEFQDQRGEFMNLIYQQHMTIYGMFVLHGVTDLMTFFRLPVFPSFNYMTVFFSFIWYGVAFYYHSQMHGKEPVEQVLHEMPIWLMFVCSLAILLETFWQEGVWTMITRSYCVLTLGTWFSHVAFILYVHDRFPGGHRSKLDRSDPNNVVFVKAMFGVHLFVNLLITICLYLFVYAALHFRMGIKLKMPKYNQDRERPVKTGQNGHYIPLSLNEKSLSDDNLEDSTLTLLEHEAQQST